MKTTDAVVKTLSLLAPAAALPPEGDESRASVPAAADAAALLRAFSSVIASRAPVFVLKNGDIAWEGDIEEHSTLQLVDVAAAEGGALELDAGFAMSRINWAAVMTAASRAIADEHFLPTPDELLRVFATAVRDAAHEAAEAFAGGAVPLLSADRDEKDGTVRVRFLGIWLADEEMANLLSPGDSCILLDQEAEGRGLKEVMLSAAMLAMVFQGTTAQAADASSGKAKTSWFASLFSSTSSARGEVLKVTSQKLVQAPPRIYRDVLDNAAGGGVKVVVDIGDQRAYLLRGGQVAFETPISTAQAGRWTPRGTYSITEKVRSGKMSTIYNCALPGWMRVGETAVGMHEGMLPGYPASHGCIRMPIESALFIFDHAPQGTTVQIVDQWSPPSAAQGALVAQN